ncbi:hypothetical protein SHI21_13355 [Bacteriovorax sp. PP10]|uniref:Uncharacterized protein n=1 Tax=Bacteriovorax antarcticus TaxID=3088717 RepID=A0ABU5VVW3_9BACT|nr:hypothetical protein [Bacteriovorax sp. PP10]MEA9357205.1 hypothetical protein [Bacteriovorax sp. PP10]
MLIGLLIAFVNIYLFPKTEYDNQKMISKNNEIITHLQKEVLLRKENELILKSTTQELNAQLEILEKKSSLLDKGFKKYKSKVGDFRVAFNVKFRFHSKEIINVPKMYQTAVLVSFISDDKSSVRFFQKPTSFSYLSVAETFKHLNENAFPYITYFYTGHADIFDDYPGGQKVEELKKFSIVSVYIPMNPAIRPELRNQGKLEIESCTLNFSLNSISIEKHIDCPQSPIIAIGEYLDSQFKEDFITVQFRLPTNVYDYLELDKF